MTPSLDTDAILEEASTIRDEDARQEYLCLRLEGHLPEVALQKSARASHRSLLTRSAPGAGMPAEFRLEDWTHDQARSPFTMDTRTAEEQEHAWARQETARRFVAGLEPRSRQILSLRFGLDGEPQTPEAVAAAVGCSISTVDRTVQRARRLVAS